jgi:hypothetical protein
MRVAPIHLLVVAMATEAASAERIVNVRNEGKKSILALAIDDEASMPTDLSSSMAAGIEVGSQEDDSVNPFIINGADLNRTVWETSRRYLVDIRASNAFGKDGHTCGATKISSRVVLTAARESKKMHLKSVYNICYAVCILPNTNPLLSIAPRPPLLSPLKIASPLTKT